MRDIELIEPYAVAEFFIDGFTKHAAHDGVMTCVGYRKMPEGNIVVIRLVWPLVNTAAAIDDAVVAMDTPTHVKPPSNGGTGPKRKVH